MGVGANVCNTSTWEVETGDSGAQGYPWLPREFKANLAYMRFYFQKKEKEKKKKRTYCKEEKLSGRKREKTWKMEDMVKIHYIYVYI